MSKLRLTLPAVLRPHACPARRVDRARRHRVELHRLAAPDIFWRMLQFKEFEISEMSLSNHATLVSTGELPFIAIPVFPSRVFRHGYFFINTDKGIESHRPQGQARRRARIHHDRGGLHARSSAARIRRQAERRRVGAGPRRPPGPKAAPDIRLTQAPAGTELGDLLERGEIDFMMCANNPLAFRRGSPKVRRLFPNYPEVEKDYYRRTRSIRSCTPW